MNTAVHPHQAHGLGRWQWGLQNRVRQTAWSNRASSLAYALKPLRHQTPVTLGTSTLTASETSHKQPLLNPGQLDALISENLLPHGVTMEALRDFDPMAYIHNRATSPSSTDEFATWSAFMTALAMPAGSDWLKSHGIRHLPQNPEQSRWLENLAKACLSIRVHTGLFPNIVWQSTTPAAEADVSVNAANVALMKLCNQPGEPGETDWATNALRNGLDPFNRAAQFERIEQRLLKLGTWLKRAEQKNRWSLGWPIKRKHPFQNLTRGLLGSELGGATPTPFTPPQRGKGFSRRGLLSALNHLVDNIQGASRLRWYGGGRAGLALQGLSIRLGQVLTGLLLRVKIKLSLHGIRQAGSEIAMPPYNMELLLLSRRGTLFRTGLGAGAGPALEPLDIHAGAELEALQNEQSHMEGIALRMPRVRGQEEELRRQFKALLADLVNPSDTFRKPGDFLKYLLTTYPTLSISELGTYRENIQSHAVQLEATASLKLTVVQLAAGLFAKLRWTRRSRRELVDDTGAIRVRKQTRLHGLECSAGARLDLKSPLDKLDSALSLTNGTLWGSENTVGSAGRSFRQDWVESDGVVHPMSFIEVEYQHVRDFESAVFAHKAEWISERAQQKQCSPEKAERELDDFMETCRRNRSSNLTYAARAELRPHCVAHINKAKGLLQLLADKNPSLREALERGIEAIRQNPASYRATSFRVYSRQSTQRRTGLQMGIQLERFDQADGVHAQFRLM